MMADEFNEERFSTRRALFMTLPVANADGTMNMSSEVPSAFGDIKAAIAHASNDVEEHGGEVIVYSVCPVRLVRLQNVVIEEIEAE